MTTPTTETKLSLESLIGSKLAVWIGAIALATGGVFLVKLSIDRGVLGPELRVIGGLLLGAAIGGISWRLRDRSNYVSQGLAASAVICLYATLWAATDLYGLIHPVLGLIGMVATTVVAVSAALRLGPLVAVMGLLGAFLAPLLVGREDPSPVTLFAYLLALQAGSQFIARRRRWVWASGISMAAGALWVLAHLLTGAGGEAWAGLFLLASTAVFTMPELLKPSAGKGSFIAVWASGGVGAGLLAFNLGVSGFEPLVWVFYMVLIAATGALGVWQRKYARLPWMTFGIAAVVALYQLNYAPWEAVPMVALMFGLAMLFVGIGFAGLMRNGERSSQAMIAAAPPAFLAPSLLLYHELIAGAGEYAWMSVLLATGAVYLVLSVVAVIRRGRDLDAFLGCLVIPAMLYPAVAWLFGLEFYHAMLLWSAQALLAFVAYRRLRLGAVRNAALIMAILVNAALLSPLMVLLADDLGDIPLVHHLTLNYAVAIGVMLTARLMSAGHAKDRAWLAISAVMLAVAGASANIRLVAGGGDLLSTDVSALELSAHATVLLLGALCMLFAAPRSRIRSDAEGRILREFAQSFTVAAIAIATLLSLTWANPWLRQEPVQGVIFLNTILIGIGLPALLSGTLSRMLGEYGFAHQRKAGWWMTGPMILMFVILQVRHLFHGPELWTGDMPGAEAYAYSLALALLSLLVLGLGIRHGSRQLRIVALIGMTVCSLKVFIWDMRELDDVYRVLSFLGLGAGLMLLGYVYHRFVPKTAPKLEKELPPMKDILTDTAPLS